MDRLLRQREQGIVSPLQVVRAETTRRAYKLEASQKKYTTVHRGAVNAMSSEQVEHRYLLSGGVDGLLYVYDGQDQRSPIRPMAGVEQGHTFAVSSVGWFPFDTGLFISSGLDGRVCVWDTNCMQTATTFQFDTRVYYQAMSPIASHCLIASASDDPALRLCDMNSGAFTHTLTGHTGAVSTCVWSRQTDHLLYSGGQDGTIRLWDIRKASSCLGLLDSENGDLQNPHNRAHPQSIHGLIITLDGNALVSLGMDEKIKHWHTYNHRHAWTHYGLGVRPHVRRHHHCAMAVSGNDVWPPLLYVPSETSVLVLTLHGRLVERLSGFYGNCMCVATLGGDVLGAGQEGEVLVWSPTTTTNTTTTLVPKIDEVINRNIFFGLIKKDRVPWINGARVRKTRGQGYTYR
ncbi:WD40-repeat-containing domain protein [Spinellus fusiger]|nr:WD40-repeat-containing domain protein [Spinellus fusiger]